ncbi:hypothetical protein [Bradyrhizobium liaoningense]
MSVELLAIDGAMNPSAEGIDIVMTAFPGSFNGGRASFRGKYGRSNASQGQAAAPRE